MSEGGNCSIHQVSGGHCGPNRGSDNLVFLNDCRHDMSIHLDKCLLSREKMGESDLILARAGIFDLDEKKIKKMTVCPTHRNNLGRYWRPPTTCQYPAHSGKAKKVESGRGISYELSKEIYTLFGKSVKVGSRKYSNYIIDNRSTVGRQSVDSQRTVVGFGELKDIL